MAICLRRSFNSGSAVMLVFRKNINTNCVNYNPFFARAFPYESVNLSSKNIYYACSLNENLTPSVFKDEIDAIHFTKFFAKEKKYCHLNYFNLLNLVRDGKVLYCAQECKAYKEESQKITGELGKAEPEQVMHILEVLSSDLPKFFKQSLNFNIYHKNIVFENNIKGTKTIGLSNYVKQLSLLRAFGHIKFAVINVDILKITAHPEDGTVRVRWRVKGITNFKIFAAILKSFPFFKPNIQEGWYDGFSIYYVRSDGLVHKHTVDKMVPDDKEKVCNFQSNLAAKIALALGVTVKDFSSPVFMETACASIHHTYLSLKCVSRCSALLVHNCCKDEVF